MLLKLEEYSVEHMYLRQTPKSENWASLTPVALQPYVVQKVNRIREIPWTLDYYV